MSLTIVLRIRVYAEVCFWYVEDEQNTRIIEKFAFSFLCGSICLLMTSSCFQLKMNMKLADVASLSHINLHCYLKLKPIFSSMIYHGLVLWIHWVYEKHGKFANFSFPTDPLRFYLFKVNTIDWKTHYHIEMTSLLLGPSLLWVTKEETSFGNILRTQKMSVNFTRILRLSSSFTYPK